MRHFLLAVMLLGLSCDSPNIRATQQPETDSLPAAPPSLPTYSPPYETFEEPEWIAFRNNNKVFHPPRSAHASWYVLVERRAEQSEQRAAWNSIAPANKAGELKIDGSSWRCICNPVSIDAMPNANYKGVRFWIVSRSIACSSDNFRTYIRGSHSAFAYPNGTASNDHDQLELTLSERGDAGVIEYSIILRPDMPTSPEAAKARMVVLAPGL